MDGKEVTAGGGTDPDRPADYTGNVLIAQSKVSSGAKFHGRLADYAIWNRPLTEAEIRDLNG